ncbi:DUF2087 domain-containing protein [Fundidesulfovibrio terrae]|uniref:DUF2087 domain-containing protein n=1 Tax=Fundidesulfovibrio terrae TaxID=2922866 RepID=UPI001FB03597|nr:DUF2087 domain-containing protein [Fundidesulfovibrio terrae]
MSRTPLPLYAGDISALARSLRGQLCACERTPGHVELLNMLARSTGYRNFQHFRTQADAQVRLERPLPQPQSVDSAKVLRAARYFDAAGQLTRWPGKFSHREPCLWVMWSKIPPRRDMNERQVNELLLEGHLFEDPALLRREMFDRGMLARTPDGRVYRRIERRPSPEALALIRLLGERRTG